MTYEQEKDIEHWREEMKDGDVVVRVMQYDGGLMKVAINRWERENTRWLRLGRFTDKESTFISSACAAAAERIKQMRLNAFQTSSGPATSETALSNEVKENEKM